MDSAVDAPVSPRTKANSIASTLPKPIIYCLAFVAGIFIASITFNFGLYWSLRSRGVLNGAVAPLSALGVYKNIVSIEVRFATYNRCLPWQTVHATFQRDLKRASKAAASGLILGKGLILTSSYVATDSHLVTVTRQGETREFQANIVAHNPELDLALLGVQDEAFWQGVDDVTVELDAAAQILGRGNEVVVAGFPGGEQLSISKLSARVARVEATASGVEGRYGSYPQTVLSLYPAIDNDVTVGPVFKESNNKLIGFIGTNNHVVPVKTIASFVNAYHKDHKASAEVGSLGMLYRPMRPLAMRMYWDMPTATKNGQQVGVQIRSVDPASPLHGLVQNGDVLVAIDGETVLANGAINYRKSVDNMDQINDIALPFGVLLGEKAIGDEVKLSFHRAQKSSKSIEGYKKIKEFDEVVKMKRLHPVAPRTLNQKTLEQPTYFMLGGLVWTILTEELVLQSEELGGVRIPSATVADALHRWRKNPEEQVVVLLRSLEHTCNKWYGASVVRILKFFNGEPVLNMKQFVSSVASALKKEEELLKFSFGALDDDDTAGDETNPDMVLDTAICAGADKDLMMSNQVHSPVSPDLVDLYNTLPEKFTQISAESHNNAQQELKPVHLPKMQHTPKISNIWQPMNKAVVEGYYNQAAVGRAAAEKDPQDAMQRQMHQLPWTNVVQIKLVTVQRDFISPWKTGGAEAARCSGIIVSKVERMILTNSHCVGDTVALDVLREDVPVPVTATVVEIAHDVDLAWITTDDESFWASPHIQETVSLAEGLPYISNDVRVVGYPVGGSSISITEGIVSRIDAQTYPNGLITSARNTPSPLLIVQIDAAINHGNSGGPVFDNQGQLVGLAFAALSANSVGYVIPSRHMKNFVAATKKRNATEDMENRWKAQPELGAIFHRVENPGMRKFLRLKDDETGVQLRTVSPKSPIAEAIAKEGIAKGDVLIKIDDMAIAGSGKVERDFNGKRVTLPFSSVITEKPDGNTTSLEFIHLDKDNEPIRKSVNVAFGPVAPLVPRFYDAPMPVKGREHFAAQPSYLVMWGLVWGVFSNPVYEQARARGKSVPWSVVKTALHQWREKDEEVVVLLQGLGSACTLNYNTQTMRILKYFNGREVTSMKDLARYFVEAEANSEAYMRITFAPLADVDIAGNATDPDIVLHRSFCATADKEVLQANNIPSQASEDVNVYLKEAMQEMDTKKQAQKEMLQSQGSLMEEESEEAVPRSADTIRHSEFLRSAFRLALNDAEEAPLHAELLSAMKVGNTEGISMIEPTLPVEGITPYEGSLEDAAGLGDRIDEESTGEENPLLLAQLEQKRLHVRAQPVAVRHLAGLREHEVE